MRKSDLSNLVMDNSLFHKLSPDELINKLKCDYKNQRSYLKQFKDDKKEVEDNKTKDIYAEIKKIKTQNKLQSQKNESFFKEFKKDHQNKKQFQENSIQKNQEEIRYAEQQKQRQRKILTWKAEQWLKEFDVTSDEGFWFEKFSASYPSKLEAAVDYIAALDDPS
ncbi:MAG: salt stress protein, Slr1339 family [cyanobacterium endosymbiont of Rhopalodia sterrenbergii]